MAIITRSHLEYYTEWHRSLPPDSLLEHAAPSMPASISKAHSCESDRSFIRLRGRKAEADVSLDDAAISPQNRAHAVQLCEGAPSFLAPCFRAAAAFETFIRTRSRVLQVKYSEFIVFRSPTAEQRHL